MKGKSKLGSVIRYIVLFVVVVAVFLGLRFFYDNRPQDTYEAPLEPITVEKPQIRDIEKTLELTGYIEPENMIPVVPFVSGTILEYLVDEGDHVEKDQLIARIDPRPYEMQKMQAEAQYLALDSSFKRVEELYKSGAATLQNYETVKAQRDAAEAQLSLADLQLSYADVTSPVEGTVIQASGATGSIGSSTQPVAVIADLDDLVVNAKISEKYYRSIKDNEADLSVRVASVDGSVSSACEVVSISPYVDATSKNFTLKVRLTENLDSFAPGMYVKVFVTYERYEGVEVLPISMRKLDGSVYVLDETDSSVHHLLFDQGISDEMYFEIPSGYLSYYFVKDGLDNVFDGQKVQVVKED